MCLNFCCIDFESFLVGLDLILLFVVRFVLWIWFAPTELVYSNFMISAGLPNLLPLSLDLFSELRLVCWLWLRCWPSSLL